ncbi:heavy metal translocating P-type ATPase [Thermodesulfobacteriota bacterium]
MRIDFGSCDLCGLPVGDGTYTSALMGRTFRFCCMGCKQVFHMLAEASDSGDPARFKDTELFKKCQDMGIVPGPAAPNRLRDDPFEPATDPLSDKDRSKLSLNLVVTDMWCPACAWVIEEVLKKRPGILTAGCNFSTDRLRCEYDPVLSSPDQIIGAVNTLGYRAFIPGDQLESKEKRKAFIRFAISAFLTANVMMLSFSLYSGFFTQLTPDAVHKISLPIFIMAGIVLFYGGFTIYQRAWAGLFSAAFGMETLITVGAFSAYLYSTFNLFSGSIHLYYDTATMLITLTLLGKTIERKAKASVQEDLGYFFSLKPTKVKRCSEEFPNGRYVSAENLRQGDLFMIEESEIIPADGLVLEGSGSIDESSLTGEARPVNKTIGERVRSGTRILSGTFKVRAEDVGEASTLGQMIKIMENALEQKTPLEGKTDRILRWFVPLVLTLSFATGLTCLFLDFSFETALIRSVTVMVIACPCALGIAIPIARVAGISLAGKKGILVRDFSAFEQAIKTNAVVFDKTGTLTSGNWKLLEISVEKSFTKEQILQLAVALEQHSDHFIATEIVKHSRANVLAPPSLDNVRYYQNGVSGIFEEDEVKIGSKDFIAKDLEEHSFTADADDGDGVLQSTVYMSYGDRLCARFIFGDVLKEGALKTVEKLWDMGYSISLVSGDNDKITRAIGNLLGIPDALGGKLPQDKAFFIRDLQKHGKRVVMVGDGVNDAPALIQADLAIAVHSGSHLGKEAADITLMQGNPEQILVYLDLAKQVNNKIQQNLIFSLLYNTLGIPIAMSGLLTPLVAVCAMLLSSLSVTGNTLLLIRKYASADPDRK